MEQTTMKTVTDVLISSEGATLGETYNQVLLAFKKATKRLHRIAVKTLEPTEELTVAQAAFCKGNEQIAKLPAHNRLNQSAGQALSNIGLYQLFNGVRELARQICNGQGDHPKPIEELRRHTRLIPPLVTWTQGVLGFGDGVNFAPTFAMDPAGIYLQFGGSVKPHKKWERNLNSYMRLQMSVDRAGRLAAEMVKEPSTIVEKHQAFVKVALRVWETVPQELSDWETAPAETAQKALDHVCRRAEELEQMISTPNEFRRQWEALRKAKES